jgi:hypothetical protein
MTPDELYAKGYSLEYATWGVTIYREDRDHPDDDPYFVGTVHFNHPHSTAEAQQRGWEAAEVDFVKRRLEA